MNTSTFEMNESTFDPLQSRLYFDYAEELYFERYGYRIFHDKALIKYVGCGAFVLTKEVNCFRVCYVFPNKEKMVAWDFRNFSDLSDIFKHENEIFHQTTGHQVLALIND